MFPQDLKPTQEVFCEALRNDPRVAEYLELSGYLVDQARAQTLLNHIQYSVVITDLRLGTRGFTGLDILRQMREASQAARTIVITGFAWPELQADAAAMGAHAFLQKPIRLTALETTLALMTGGEA